MNHGFFHRYLLVPVPYVASIMLLGAISSPVPGTFVDEVNYSLHIVRDSESRMEFAFLSLQPGTTAEVGVVYVNHWIVWKMSVSPLGSMVRMVRMVWS